MTDLYRKLLRQYSDELLSHQFKDIDASINGGVYCPSCKVIHGRCIDGIYGLCAAYKTFGERKYLQGAEALLRYSGELLCKDGGLYNDLQTTWRFTTVFFVIDIAETLLSLEDILPPSFAENLKKRLKTHADWLYKNLDEHSKANINYPTNNALALYLAGAYLHEERFLKQGKKLASYALSHTSESGLFYGEGKPHDKVTPRGCRAIDIGYNLEESLPALAKFAFYSKDEEMLKKVHYIGKSHLDFILPDGAIDNSFGCRNYKWTYYGSRTCDGLIPLCLILSKYEPAFKEAAYRNLTLIDRCSSSGLLSGGPDYIKHGEKPCMHHTFEHLNAIAFGVLAFEEKAIPEKGIPLPSDSIYERYYSEMDAYRFGTEEFLFDISCYDENISYSGHASGATLTLLYSRSLGPLVAGSVGDYELTESTNMQVPLDTENHRPLLPRFETFEDGILYSSAYFVGVKKEGEGLSFCSALSDRVGRKLPGSEFRVSYQATPDRFRISLSAPKLDLPFLLPLINGRLNILEGTLRETKDIFFLTPGFEAKEYSIDPNKDGQIVMEIAIDDKR